ncbi:hypothetical protein TWF694_011385 [Orbilia ellipsospora]|uniref:Peptidase C14 caspase domain-containing protein n=1 Tax=Orbilia ellipsospora TaxID=2528407 RepID=A0AAV9X535_9PEZI
MADEVGLSLNFNTVSDISEKVLGSSRDLQKPGESDIKVFESALAEQTVKESKISKDTASPIKSSGNQASPPGDSLRSLPFDRGIRINPIVQVVEYFFGKRLDQIGLEDIRRAVTRLRAWNVIVRTVGSRHQNSNFHRGTWALLVGIDCYIPGDKRPVSYPNLRGCVSDVKAVKEYIVAIGFDHIAELTSSRRPGSNYPIEEGKANLPIYDNIERELGYIIDEASAGDLVYIHYSGHGIRRQTLESLPDQKLPGDGIDGTALALADVMSGGAYLTGHRLASLQRKCEEVGGWISEGYSGLRTANGGLDQSLLESDRRIGVEATKINHVGEPNPRSRIVERSWLTNPTGCTVLVACDFNKSAFEEIPHGTNSTHGVFTSRMLQRLKSNISRRRPTYADIRYYVESTVGSPKQSPVLYGDRDYVFLGNALVVQRPASHILSYKNDFQVRLDVGFAQGVVVGSLYNVYRKNQLPSRATTPLFTATIVEALRQSPFRSIAWITSSVAPADFISRSHRTLAKKTSKELGGGNVVLVSWALPCSVVQTFYATRRISAAQVATLKQELDISYPSEFYFSNHERETDLSPTLAIDLDEDGIFEIYILDNDSKQWNRAQRIPSISAMSSNWVRDLIYILRHLSRFRAIKDIYIGPPFSRLPPSCLQVTVKTIGSSVIEIPRVSSGYHVPNRTAVSLTFALSEEYIASGSGYLFVSFYMLNSSWGISKLHPAVGEPAISLSKIGNVRFTIEMQVPQRGSSKDPDEVKDIVRVFFCDARKSWEDIMLPNLPIGAVVSPLKAETEILEVLYRGSYDKKNARYKNRELHDTSEETEYESQSERTETWGLLDITLHTSLGNEIHP